MKSIFTIIIFLIIITFSLGISAATNDSLPTCVTKMAMNNTRLFTEYDYKGQRWFVIAKVNARVENYPDKLTTIQFYDENCKLVGIWQKGGVAGLNKTTPDTIDKKKIILIRTIRYDTLIKKDTNHLPEAVSMMANKVYGITIQEYMYNGQKLYLINVPLSAVKRKELLNKGIVTVDEPYYDVKGKVVILYKRALEGSFMRAARWIPSSVKQADVIKVQDGYWYRKDGIFKK